MQRKAPRPASPGGRLRVRGARSDEVRRLPDSSPFSLFLASPYFVLNFFLTTMAHGQGAEHRRCAAGARRGSSPEGRAATGKV